MVEKTLHLLAATADPTISQVLHGLTETPGVQIVVFEEVARLFSSTLRAIGLLLIDEAIAPNYASAIRRMRRRFPAVDVVVVGGPKSDEVVAAEKRAGVDYYYERPVEPVALRAALEHRLSFARLKATVGLIGRTPEIEEIVEAILQVGPTEVPILIEGESGTGKDIVARAVHAASRRSDKPYVAINVGSLAEGVLESELFGHEKGAFTGAVAQRPGVFERANGGTIFLDEVGEMSPNMQVRLLRVLESGEVLRVGGVKSLHVNVRIVAATNRRLAESVRGGSFRQDLYYRLKGVSLRLPPLRERREDIPLLVDYFIREANRKHHKNVSGIASDALRRVVEYPWQGNVRELRNVIDTVVVLASSGKISLELIEGQLIDARRGPDLLPVLQQRSTGAAEREMIYAAILALHRDVREVLALLHGQPTRPGGALDGAHEIFADRPPGDRTVQNLSQLERAAILEALRASNGNRRKASELLGISERTLYRKIKEYGLV